jgi:hypothetical protein
MPFSGVPYLRIEATAFGANDEAVIGERVEGAHGRLLAYVQRLR